MSLRGCAADESGRRSPCAEVTLRLLAADRSEREGQRAAATGLRHRAETIAAVHLAELSDRRARIAS